MWWIRVPSRLGGCRVHTPCTLQTTIADLKKEGFCCPYPALHAFPMAVKSCCCGFPIPPSYLFCFLGIVDFVLILRKMKICNWTLSNNQSINSTIVRNSQLPKAKSILCGFIYMHYVHRYVNLQYPHITVVCTQDIHVYVKFKHTLDQLNFMLVLMTINLKDIENKDINKQEFISIKDKENKGVYQVLILYQG